MGFFIHKDVSYCELRGLGRVRSNFGEIIAGGVYKRDVRWGKHGDVRAEEVSEMNRL